MLIGKYNRWPQGEHKMPTKKRTWLAVVSAGIMLLGSSFDTSPANAGGWYGGHYWHGGYGGWYGPAIGFGAGLAFGSLLARPYYYPRPYYAQPYYAQPYYGTPYYGS